MKLSQTITEIRKEKELTQEEFAKEFNVTRQTVSNWENGKSYPDLLTLVKISDMYGCSLDRMLKEDYDMTEAMNRSIEEGKQFRQNTLIDFLFPAIGFVCCTVMVMSSLVDRSGVFLVMIWVLCALMNLFILFKKIKSMKLIESIEDQYRKLTNEDIELVNHLNDRGMNVEAVKIVRKITGIGLYEAKILVDEMKKQ